MYSVILCLCAVFFTACQSQKTDNESAIVKVKNPLEEYIENKIDADMDVVESKALINCVMEQDGQLVSEESNFCTNVYTYVSSSEESLDEETERKCTAVVDIEFTEKLELTSDCYLVVEFDDQVSPTALNGALYYRDNLEDDWIYYKDISAQSLFSLSRFTFFGSDMKKDTEKHYFRLVAAAEDADFYPSSKDYVNYTIIYQTNEL